jgi:hypothetical protein
MTTSRSEHVFQNDRAHRTKRGEARTRAPQVPSTLVCFLQELPSRVVYETCDRMGHPSFWHGGGYRFSCICGAQTYFD